MAAIGEAAGNHFRPGASISVARQPLRFPMTIGIVALQPLVALLAGILILVMPRLLNYIVAIYLIIVGITGLWPHLMR